MNQSQKRSLEGRPPLAKKRKVEVSSSSLRVEAENDDKLLADDEIHWIWLNDEIPNEKTLEENLKGSSFAEASRLRIARFFKDMDFNQELIQEFLDMNS